MDVTTIFILLKWMHPLTDKKNLKTVVDVTGFYYEVRHSNQNWKLIWISPREIEIHFSTIRRTNQTIRKVRDRGCHLSWNMPMGIVKGVTAVIECAGQVTTECNLGILCRNSHDRRRSTNNEKMIGHQEGILSLGWDLKQEISFLSSGVLSLWSPTTWNRRQKSFCVCRALYRKQAEANC